MKAFLVFRGRDLSKTQDMEALLAQCVECDGSFIGLELLFNATLHSRADLYFPLQFTTIVCYIFKVFKIFVYILCLYYMNLDSL